MPWHSLRLFIQGSSRATGRKALSAEELEERRRAMMGNAQWRDKVRDENLQRAQHRQQREEEMAEKSSAPTFIRYVRISEH